MTHDRLAALTLERARTWEGRRFRLSIEGVDAIEADLVRVSDESRPDGRHAPEGGRDPFALHFRPVTPQALTQGTYTIEAEGLEPMAVFCTPVYADDPHGHLQAVFH